MRRLGKRNQGYHVQLYKLLTAQACLAKGVYEREAWRQNLACPLLMKLGAQSLLFIHLERMLLSILL